MSSWMPTAMVQAAHAAALAAPDGSRNTAYLTNVQGQIAANYKRQLWRDSVMVWEVQCTGLLPISGSNIELPAGGTPLVLLDADIDTGVWRHVVQSTVTPANKIRTVVTKSTLTGPGKLTADLAAAGSLVQGIAVLSSPAYDSGVGASPYTLAGAYATAMTSLNNFPPGNECVGSTWPGSVAFPTSPWGSNVDQMITSGAGGNQEGAIVSRGSDRMLTWGWLMPPKGVFTPAGNWRAQIRDFQTACKVDALTNPWNRFFGPAQPLDYGPNAGGGRRSSGNITSCNGAIWTPLYDEATNLLDPRVEPSGGMSFKGVGTTASRFQVEVNVPDGDPATSTLPATCTADRCKAFAGVFWARLIPDTGSGPIPAGIHLGALMGIDFYGPDGRRGNPGWSRLVQLDENWRPVVMAFALDPANPTQPMSPSALGAWLSANPPPFV